MINLLSYYGLTDSRMSASEKDLPVLLTTKKLTLKTLGYWGQGLSPLLVSGGWGKISNVVIDFAP